MQSLLHAEALEVWRGENCLFESLDFDLAAGQLALLVGPNGAGKTTLLRILAGLTLPTAGRVSLSGTGIRDLSPEQRGQVGFLGHADGLKKDLTVRENLKFNLDIRNGTENIHDLATPLRIGGKLDVRVRYLSAGQRRRVAFACLKLAGAKLWILDEPMTHLDSGGRELVKDWLREHVAAGGAAVVATHQPDELASRGALMIEL